jgi:malonyl-CoA O-methyltransferase
MCVSRSNVEPTIDVDVQRGYALWAPTYRAEAHNALMRAEERGVLTLLPASLQGMRVLDAGCGSGRYLRELKARGAQAVGVDLSSEMLAGARRLQLPVAQAALDRLPLADGWADLMVCALTLGHLSNLCFALQELARVLRTAGTLVCSDFHPVGDALGWRRTFSSDGRRYAIHHVSRWYSDWQRACETAGFSIETLIEPRLDPADIPLNAHFDRRALTLPVAMVWRFTKR